MNLILNIGFGNGAAPTADVIQRYRRDQTFKHLAHAFGTFSVECGQTEQERLLIVEVPGCILPRQSFDPWAFHLCRTIGQDAIACYEDHAPRDQRGYLIGPNAPRWQPFDLSKFIFPSRRFA